MKIQRRFTQQGQDVFDTVEWTTRASRIANLDGSVVFEMKDAQVPAAWSQLATDIMVSKYFRKAGVPEQLVPIEEKGVPAWLCPHTAAEGAATGPEKSARQVIHRLAGCWTYWGHKHGYFDSEADAQTFYDELCHMMLHQMVAPNSPQWFNTGLNWAYGIDGPAQGHYVVDPKTGKTELAETAYKHPQPHACVAGDTRVLTSEGWMTIREVVEDDRTDLKIFDGQCWTKLVATKHNGVRPTHRMMLANGQYVDLTDDHLVLAAAKRGKDGGTYAWTPAGEALGMKVLFALNEDHVSEEATAGRQHVARKTAELVGFHVGDGYAGTYEGISHFGVCTATDDEFARVTDLFEYEFGSYTVTAKPEVGPEYRIVRHDFAETIAFREGFELGLGSRSVRVPERIFRAEIEAQRAFLKGLFQADGAVRIRQDGGRNSGDIVLATTSRELAHGVQTLLTGLGIYSRTSECHDQREDRGTLYHVIVAYASEREKFAQQIGFVDRRKREKLAELNRRVEGKRKGAVSEETVVSFRELGEQDVYDIQTGTGRFAANGVVVHNCFIQEVTDDLVNAGGIMDLWTREARLFKYGSGTGTNFSSIRGENEPLSGGGKSSGLMSFLKIGDRAAGAIKSGGTTRRAAKMVCLDLDHPDIEDFATWKVREELKVAALVEGIKHLKGKYQEEAQELGLDKSLTYDFNGEAYQTVSGQNSNNSVRIPNKFFHAVDENEAWETYRRTDGKVARTLSARDLWRKICQAAWQCADPGVQFDTTINEWHTCPESGRINASNPCSEYMFLDNTACNLASLNLLTFYDAKTRTFDLEGYEHGIELWTVVLEISVLMAAFPSEEIARLSYEFRTLGLGYANIGAMLMQAGIPYDSDRARAICGALTAILTGRSYATSAQMAKELGPFPGYGRNREAMLRVIRNHRRAAYGVPRDPNASNDTELAYYEGLEIPPVPIDHAQLAQPDGLANAPDLLAHAHAAWDDALHLGEEYGYRNAQVSVIAPTGTIGLLMDCDTTGVEPDFALVKFKKLAGGGYFKIANQSLRPALESLGYTDEQVQAILTYVLGTLRLDVPMPGEDGKSEHDTFDTFEQFLRSKGFRYEDLAKVVAALPTVFELVYAFSPWSLGEDLIERLGLAEHAQSPSFNLLRALGLSKAQIKVLNGLICGTQTVEGAPDLKDEHLPVFDCANTCGPDGERFIQASGHIRMMAAAQPFISGAISKTINLPNSASIEDIEQAYRLSWELGLKANALYRDGCKLSQPLSNKVDADEEVDDEENVQAGQGEVTQDVAQVAAEVAADVGAGPEQARTVEKIVERIVERPLRRRLPDTRRSITHKFSVAGHEGYITVGLYDDGQPGELFITMAKEGSTIGGLMDSLGTAISIALQYGVPIESLVTKFTHQRFEPAGMTHNPDVPFAKSLVDYIFRYLGMEFVPGYRAANAPQRPAQPAKSGEVAAVQRARDIAQGEGPGRGDRHGHKNGNGNGNGAARAHPVTEPTRPSPTAQVPVETTVEVGEKDESRADRDAAAKPATAQSALTTANASLQADAPACDVCGTITIRNGTCYKCLNCGNSMGCS